MTRTKARKTKGASTPAKRAAPAKRKPSAAGNAVLRKAAEALPDPANSPYCSIPEALDELRQGRMIVLTDDADRENEGDLVLPAEHVTPEAINFMLREGRGMLFVALDGAACDRLNLPFQTAVNTTQRGTAYTITVDAAERFGITTGVSASDRATTIRKLVEPGATAADFDRPGHIQPLRARDGGVLVRAGHTEGMVDLCRLAGLRPGAVGIEVMNADGTMARLSHLELFAAEHKLKIASISDLIEYRRTNEKLVEHVVDVDLPTKFGPFRCHVYQSTLSSEHHVALVKGEIRPGTIQKKPVVVRVHSECLTGDAFGSLRCDCGDQLQTAMSIVATHDRGVVLYMRQEGRGIGLVNKLRAYRLQDGGADTVEANKALGFSPDLRRYGLGAQILYDLGLRKLKLITNNPRKIVGLNAFGLEVLDRVPLKMPSNPSNRNYLRAKKNKLGHLLDDV
ncbi:MAG: bifunctional 3,4-dihydroxy-2-butanone-4-phosphate synthase/GTP cyclohydrolase II [Planctomycetota bacterium]|nr:bifunctional 3,4-dihydroxy-2-butanone-4-phosphate synthase/GTP cyclohydrolase II [Planctomycetota bacterium]